MASPGVSVSMWRDGACRAIAFDRSRGHGGLVEYNGNGTLRLAALTARGFEEVITTRRMTTRGLAIRTSTLAGDRDGALHWHWSVHRPGLHRHEHWHASNGTPGSWQQVDMRPGRVTTFVSTGPNRYRGEVTAPDGTPLWSADWQADGAGGMAASYADPGGNPAGTLSYPGRERRSEGEPVSWTGPGSSGSVRTTSNGGITTTTVVKDGARIHVTDEGDGHQVEHGDAPGRTWLKITVPGKAPGDTQWVVFGTETTAPTPSSPGGSSADYTIGGKTGKDGSKSFSRTSTDNGNGDKETTFGSTDADGNFSYSQSIEHADGSVTLVTRSVDKAGNGTEHVTEVDALGNETGDETYVIQNGRTVDGTGGQPTSDSGGQPGDNSGSGPSDNSGSGPSDNSGNDSNGVTASDDSDSDPNNPDEPDTPDAPDSDGTGTGMPSDDGSGDDGAPRHPLGKIGRAHSDVLGELFEGIRSGRGDDGDDGDNRDAALRNDEWILQLTEELLGAGSGTGADDSGWGGGEGPREPPAFRGTLAAPAHGADDSGWGDVTDPRVLVGVVANFATAAVGMAGSRTLLQGLQG
ncbi:MAG: hypothetical protein ACJ8LG_21405 [Massilia sp.]